MADLALTYNEPVATGWLRTELYGDHARAALHLQAARGLLGTLRATTGVNARIAEGEAGGFYRQQLVTDDGVFIEATTNNGMDMIRITAPGGTSESAPENKTKTASVLDQSLWIGVRMISGGEHELTKKFDPSFIGGFSYDFHYHNYETAVVHMCVWEPSVNGAEPEVLSNRHALFNYWMPVIFRSGFGSNSYQYPSDTFGIFDSGVYPLRNNHTWPIDISQAANSNSGVTYPVNPTLGVGYTQNGLMQRTGMSPHKLFLSTRDGRIITYDRHFDSLREFVAQSGFSYDIMQRLSDKMFVPGTPSTPVMPSMFNTGHVGLEGEYDAAVFFDKDLSKDMGLNHSPRTGWYTVKVMFSGDDTLAYTPLKLEVTVVVGKGECLKTASAIVTISEFTRYFRGLLPKGYFLKANNHGPDYHIPDPTDARPTGDYGANPMGKHWWQGGVHIYLAPIQTDVPVDQLLEHMIVVVNDGSKLVPPTGFNLDIEFPPRADRVSRMVPANL